MSSWFGGGKKKEEEPERGFLDHSEFAGAGTTGSNMYDSSSLGGGGGAGGGANAGLVEFQQFSVNLQQQVLIQQIITDMTEKSFKLCCPISRDNKLSGKEVACIHSTTNKWLDCNELMMGRLARKQQQQQGNGQGF